MSQEEESLRGVGRRGLRHLFPSLDEEGRAYWEARMSGRSLAKGDVLFREGDPSDALYVVLQGRLATVARNERREEIVVSVIGPVETVGENGLVSGDPRDMTIKALTDSRLLRLSRDDFAALHREHPSILLDLARLLARRHTKNIQKLITKNEQLRKIALVRTGSTPTIEAFLGRFEESLSSVTGSWLVSSDDLVTQVGDDATFFLDLIEYLSLDLTCLVFDAELSDPRLGLFYESFFDAVVWLVDAESSPEICRRQWEDRFPRVFSYNVRREMLLVRRPGAPRRARPWLEGDAFDLVHHVELDNLSDYSRVVRFLRGEAVGVVLSGGEARGWFHLGALRALQEARIPIDAIGGASSGAFVAACYAETPVYDDYRRMVHDAAMANADHMALRNFTMPKVSIFNDKRATDSLMASFGDRRIEDLQIPFFCVSCNLNRNRETTWRQGKLWKRIRSSLAVPGILSPVIEEGALHFDGGLVNNLPVDAMRRLLPPGSAIIAVDVTDTSIDETRYDFPANLGFVDSLLAYFRLTGRRYRFPSFRETFLKALMVGAIERIERNRVEADFLIRSDLGSIGMTDVRAGMPLIETGYRETHRLLEALPDTDRSRFLREDRVELRQAAESAAGAGS